MIGSTVTVVDRLIQLLTVRERNREKRFRTQVEPLYKDAEVIARDYFALFRELIRRLEEGEDVPTIIKWLEDRRLEALPVRIKLRSFLKRTSYEKINTLEKSMGKFERGMWGLMKGGLSLTDEGHTDLREYGWQDHTVLDLLYLWSQEPIEAHRDRYLRNAKGQLSSMERAWQDCTEGYAELSQELT